MPFKLSAAIFDMDGLMLDTEPLARAAWRQVLAEQGHLLSDTLFLETLGHTTEDTQAILQRAFGADLPFAALYQRKLQYVRDRIDQAGVPTKAGLLELLLWLESRHIPRAVASSAKRGDVTHKLEKAGLLGRFGVIVSGDMVPHGKPAPDVFLAAARQLQRPASECVALEDSDAGIQAAHAAGMLPLMVPDLKPPSPESCALAHRIFNSLHEVKAFLEQAEAD